MEKARGKWLEEAVFIYCAIYTVATIISSILYLLYGVREDPNGNWHEISRALIVLIGVMAFELYKYLPIRNMILKALITYIPTMLLAFITVWFSQFIEPLSKSAYSDIFINYSGMFLIISVVAIITSNVLKKKKN